LASHRLVLGDVLVQLLLLLSQFLGRILALSSLNLQSQHLELQLEDLVLDLASLQRLPLGRVLASGSLDGLVESAGLGLCRLGGLPCSLENCQVLSVDRGKVGLVNLGV
jgi:hypothetical protein